MNCGNTCVAIDLVFKECAGQQMIGSDSLFAAQVAFCSLNTYMGSTGSEVTLLLIVPYTRCALEVGANQSVRHRNNRTSVRSWKLQLFPRAILFPR